MTALNNPALPYDYVYRVLIVGDEKVGKTSLFCRFSDNTFSQNYIPTLGLDFKLRTVEVDEKMVKLQIWDSTGCGRYLRISEPAYRMVQGIIFVYDATNAESFHSIKKWVRFAKKITAPSTQKILIANKMDMNDGEKVVSQEEGEAFAAKLGIPFFACSALTSQNVEDAFFSLLQSIARLPPRSSAPPPPPSYMCNFNQCCCTIS